MIPNIIQQKLDLELNNLKIIPMTFMATKFYTVAFEGWGEVVFTCEDETMTNIVNICIFTLRGIVSTYKENHAFEKPMLSYIPNKKLWLLKIGIMENERYEELLEKYKP